jgi:hypothetical protein
MTRFRERMVPSCGEAMRSPALRKPGRTFSLADVVTAAKRDSFAGKCEASAFLHFDRRAA